MPLCGGTNLNTKYFKHTFTNLSLSSCFLNMITFILAAWKRYEKIYYCFANSLQMLRLITLFLFLSCSSPSLDTSVSLSPVSPSKVSVTPPGCTLDAPKAFRNSVRQLPNSVCNSHWIPLCTRAPAALLGQAHMVHFSSKLKPPLLLGNCCFLLPVFDFCFPSSGVSVLTPGGSVSLVFVETGMSIGEAPVVDWLVGNILAALAGGWLVGKILAVLLRSLVACSARSLDLADCKTRDEAHSPRVLGDAVGTILGSWLGLGRLWSFSRTLYVVVVFHLTGKNGFLPDPGLGQMGNVLVLLCFRISCLEPLRHT